MMNAVCSLLIHLTNRENFTMKSSIIAFALIAISLSTPFVSASPTDTDMDKQLSDMQKDMNLMLQQIAKLRQQAQLQENINKMQSQLDRLQRTTDPNERQKLIQEHLDTLQEHMKMIETMDASEGGSGDKKKAIKMAPATPGRMIYGPGPMGFPGGMMYGPGMTGGPQGYPGGTATPRYR
jgi:TolA-binding protein